MVEMSVNSGTSQASSSAGQIRISWLSRCRRMLWLCVVAAVVSYLLLILAGIFLPSRMLYHPPADRTQEAEFRVPSAAGDEIALAWYPAAEADAPVILYSHGNAEDLERCDWLFKEFQRAGFTVCAYDYPGYGASSGTPTEAGCYAAIDACWQWLCDERGVDPAKVIICGRSLGGGPSCYLAAQNKGQGGVVLLSPFVTAFRVVTRAPLLWWDQFPNKKHILQSTGPVLIIHGDKDRVIPSWHGRHLAEVLGDRATGHWLGDAAHNDLFMQFDVIQAIKDWREAGFP